MGNAFNKFLEYQYISHRGNWSKGIPENSMEAFRRAVEGGFAIELDVHLLADNEVAVFHDYTLTRMCRRPVKLCNLTSSNLSQYPLKGTKYTIPLIDEVLDMVNGRVPLYIEIKKTERYIELVDSLMNKLEGYDGLIAFLCFDYRPLQYIKDKYHYPVALSQMIVNKVKLFDFEPDGICANILFLKDNTLRNRFPVISWTSSSQRQLNKAKRVSDLYIINTKYIL